MLAQRLHYFVGRSFGRLLTAKARTASGSCRLAGWRVLTVWHISFLIAWFCMVGAVVEVAFFYLGNPDNIVILLIVDDCLTDCV